MSETTPPPTPVFRRNRDLGDLQTLLLTACPKDSVGRTSIPVLSKHLGVSDKYIYKWITDKRVPAGFVRPLVEMSDGRVELSDFHPYVFG